MRDRRERDGATGGPACLVGVGRPSRGDDAAGWLAARRAGRGVGSDVRVVLCGADAIELLDAWDGCATTVVVDAARMDAAPDTVARFDASYEPLPAISCGASTHGLGLHDAIETARALGRLPARTIVLAIGSERFEPGRIVTAEVRLGVREAAAFAAAELSTSLGHPGVSMSRPARLP